MRETALGGLSTHIGGESVILCFYGPIARAPFCVSVGGGILLFWTGSPYFIEQELQRPNPLSDSMLLELHQGFIFPGNKENDLIIL